MRDNRGIVYARLSDLKPGDMIELDEDFDCVRRPEGIRRIVQVLKKSGRLGFACSEGFHDLDGQLSTLPDADDSLVGVYLVGRPSDRDTKAQSAPGWECPACHLRRGPDRHDPCLGELPGVSYACCGHGGFPGTTVRGSGYVVFANGKTLRFAAGARVDGVGYPEIGPYVDGAGFRDAANYNSAFCPYLALSRRIGVSYAEILRIADGVESGFPPDDCHEDVLLLVQDVVDSERERRASV